MDRNRINYLEEKIAQQEEIKQRIDGRGHNHLGNRAYGIGHIAAGGLLYTCSSLFLPFSTLFFIDGLGDLITGKHHYLLYKAISAHPNDEIKKLEKEIMIEMIG